MSTNRRLRPRKSPVQQRSRETVEAVVGAAAQVFQRYGYAAGTTNRIAERAGVSIGSLYQYFPNKDAILVELVHRHIADGVDVLTPVLRELAEGDVPASQGIRRAVAAMVALHRADPGLHRVLFEESPRPAEITATLDALREDAVQQVSGWLTRCPDAAVSDPDLAAEMVVQVIDSVAHGPVIHPRHGRDPDVYAAEAARLLVAYLTGGEDGDMSPNVRVAVPETADAGEILTVQRAAYVAEAQLYGDPFLPPLVESLPQVREAIRRAAGGDGVVFKACLGARVVGAVRAKRAGRVGSVARLAVAPDVQGRGVGTALLVAVEDALRGHVEELVLSTGERSDGNLRFCRRLGYAESRRERLAPHLGTVHLRKPLDPRPGT